MTCQSSTGSAVDTSVTIVTERPKPFRVFVVAGKPYSTKQNAIRAATKAAVVRECPVLVVQLSISAITSRAIRVSVDRVNVDGQVTKLAKNHPIVFRGEAAT